MEELVEVQKSVGWKTLTWQIISAVAAGVVLYNRTDDLVKEVKTDWRKLKDVRLRMKK